MVVMKASVRGDGASHYGGGVSIMVDVGDDGSFPGCHRGGGGCREDDGGRGVLQLLLTAARVRAGVPVRCRCSLPRGRWKVCEEGKPPHAQVFVFSAWDDVGSGGYIAGGTEGRLGTFVAPARQKQRREVAASVLFPGGGLPSGVPRPLRRGGGQLDLPWHKVSTARVLASHWYKTLASNPPPAPHPSTLRLLSLGGGAERRREGGA